MKRALNFASSSVLLFLREQYALVLSDVNMPRLDGVALAKHLLSTIPIIPIFLMSAYECNNMDDILKLGVPCLSKPLSLNQLLLQVQKVLGQHGQREL